MDRVKRLARELGFVETITIRQNVFKEQETSLTFDYLVVVDFESTCWDSKDQQSRWQYLPEIIEFPAVLLNLRSGLIEEEFHHYVMPVENPILSDFCVKLTGITQDVVDAGIPLGTCIMLFNHWLSKISSEKKISFHKSSVGHKTCTFATWSDWDFAVCLQNETKRKQICKPDVLSQWIDLRQSYRKFYQRKPQGLKGALTELGLSFSGREHSGIIDARNTAKLVYRMIEDGCCLAITSSCQKSSPQVSAKRCPLGTLSNTSTPVSRQPQSLRFGVLNDHVIISSKTRPQTKAGEYRREQNSSAVLETTNCNLFAKKVSQIQTSKGTVTPKRSNIVLSSCKRTPPLCRCGRRAVFKVANSPGPNQGRSFFSCPNQKKSLGMVSKGCSFFMWC